MNPKWIQITGLEVRCTQDVKKITSISLNVTNREDRHKSNKLSITGSSHQQTGGWNISKLFSIIPLNKKWLSKQEEEVVLKRSEYIGLYWVWKTLKPNFTKLDSDFNLRLYSKSIKRTAFPLDLLFTTKMSQILIYVLLIWLKFHTLVSLYNLLSFRIIIISEIRGVFLSYICSDFMPFCSIKWFTLREGIVIWSFRRNLDETYNGKNLYPLNLWNSYTKIARVSLWKINKKKFIWTSIGLWIKSHIEELGKHKTNNWMIT